MTQPAEFFPPSLAVDGARHEWEPESSGVRFHRRELTPESAGSLALQLRRRAAALRRVPHRRILRGLGNCHRDWARPRSARRDEAVDLLTRVTGYAPEVLDSSLLGLFAAMSAEEMETWLVAGGILRQWLDPVKPSAQGETLVFGPALTVVVSSGNIPGASLPSVVQALLLKSPCLVKTSSAEPALLPLYARSLAEHAPEVAEALAVTGWTGGDESVEDALACLAEAWLVYGSNHAVASLGARIPPHARFVGYGHRISFSAVGRELLAPLRVGKTARRAALDFCAFDQQGCLSPQTVYVERGGRTSPEEFAERLTGVLDNQVSSLPRRPLSAAESAAIHQYRAGVEMRAASANGDGPRLWTSAEGTHWTVVYEPNPQLEPGPLNRTVVVRPVGDLEELSQHLDTTRTPLISVALGTGIRRRPRLARMLAELGVTRVTDLGRAQEPQNLLYHDGRNPIAALARFVRIEE